MTPDELDALEESGGKGLRARLEAELKKNAKLSNQLRTETVVRVIKEKGFSRVKPEDFSDVDPALIESKAEELEAQRAASEAEVLRNALRRTGVSEDQIEAQVAALTGPAPSGEQTTTTDADAWAGVRAAGQTTGGPVAPDFSKMSAAQKMEYGLTHPAKKA